MTVVLAVSMIVDFSMILAVSMKIVAVTFRSHPQKLGVVVVVVPGVSSPKGSSSFIPRVSFPKRSSSFPPGVFPPREARAASMIPRSPAGEGPLSYLGFRPPGEALCRSSGFCSPRESGAALMMPRSPAGVGRI